MTAVILTLIAAAMIGGALASCWLAILVLRETEHERTELSAKGRRCGLSPRS